MKRVLEIIVGALAYAVLLLLAGLELAGRLLMRLFEVACVLLWLTWAAGLAAADAVRRLFRRS